MNILNEKMEHAMFGTGVITEIEDNRIKVQFQDEIGIKMFLYPEAFERFLKAEDPTVESYVLEELHRKQEQMELERIEKEREAVELKEKMTKLEFEKKRTRKKKA